MCSIAGPKAIDARRSERELLGLAAEERGAALLEFTVVASLLLFLVFGMIQYGLALYVYNNMFDAARQAARELAVDTQAAEEAEADAEARALELLTARTWPAAEDWTIVAEDGVDQVRVEITLSAVDASIIDLVPLPAQLRAEVVMHKE